MPVRIKICGITNLADAAVAVKAGADALGFVFCEQSPRRMTIPAVAEITRRLHPAILRVGVFVNAPAEFVSHAIARADLSVLQFHGDETPEFCTQFGLMSMKAFRMRDARTLDELPKYETDAWLLDAWTPQAPGGTGETFNWDLALQAKAAGKPIFLAGGLTPENVAEAVRRVDPFGVDVSSGVESAPGCKDHAKVVQFINAVKSVAG